MRLNELPFRKRLFFPRRLRDLTTGGKIENVTARPLWSALIAYYGVWRVQPGENHRIYGVNHNSRNLAIQMSGAILHGAQKDSADPKDDDLDDDESGKFVRDAVPAKE